MSDINTPPIKLFHIAKTIIAQSPEIPEMIAIVPFRSIFFSGFFSMSSWGSCGKVRKKRCRRERSDAKRVKARAHHIPSCPTANPERADTTVNISPLLIPTSQLALSRFFSSKRRVTNVERVIIRILPMTPPIITSNIKSHKRGFPASCQISVL